MALRQYGEGESRDLNRLATVITPFALLSIIFFSTSAVTRSQQEGILAGKVVDALTGRALDGSIVHIWGWVTEDGGGQDRYDSYLFTNETGDYDIILSRGHYWITVTADDPETPGMDFVPGFLQLDMAELNSNGSVLVADFRLVPGASAIITGSADFVESGRAPEEMNFGLMDTYYGAPSLGRSLTYYDPEMSAALGLGPGFIVVPANMPILVYGESSGSRFIVDDNGSYFVFRQGSVVNIDISEAVMNRNVDVVRDKLASMWLRAEELEVNGIDVEGEMDDLETAFGFLELARLSLREHSYSQCFMNLRAAYIMCRDLQASIQNALSDVAFSPIPLSFLLVLSGFGLASVFVEREGARIGSGLPISLLLLGFYYYISPGWRFADPVLLLASSTAAAFLAIGFATMFPKIRNDIVTPSGIALASSLTSTFSLATRNLKRRRLRSSLVLASILTLVFGFTVFTSYRVQATVGTGIPPMPYPGGNPPTGLMVIPPPCPTAAATYGILLPTSMVDALRADPLVVSVAPKADTSPSYLEAQLIGEDGRNVAIRGAIGVSGEEVKMNHLDAAIIEGHYMAEGERAILISASAADQLDVAPGGKVKFSWRSSTGTFVAEFMIAGILDDEIFRGIVDLDGQPIRPYFTQEREKLYIDPVNVVVFNWKELVGLKLGDLARINVQVRDDGDVVPLAIELARKWRYYVYASLGGEVRLYNYRKDPVLLGGSTMLLILALVGLNVLACTLNAVYERKKEIATLSLVGLNPSQISYIFLAEAVLVAFIGGATGYLLGIGVPRILLNLGGPGFVTEKVSWTWSLAVISMAAMVTVSASVIPALKASTIATPKLPLKWKLDYLPSSKDMWLLHVPQLISQPELGRFFRFLKGHFEEMQLLRTIPEKMEFRGMVDEPDRERDVRKLLFAYSFAQEGSRAFRTENELVASRGRDSSTYAVDLVIRIAMLYNYQPSEVVMKTAKAVRRFMLQWSATPSSERWGQTAEVIRLEGLSVVSDGAEVLRGINMSVMKAEIVGLMGEGRRALILAIAGLCKPSSGSALFGGMDTYSRRNETKNAMGVLLRGTELYEGFSPRWNLRFLAKLEGRADAEAAVNGVLERCNLSQHADERMSKLSSEKRGRMKIAQMLIRNVSLLLIEDPFTGLKEDEARGIEGLLMDLNRSEGITIVCTGRDARELAFCNRILTLEEGMLRMNAEGKGEAIG